MAYVQSRGNRHTGYYRSRNGLRYSAGTFDSAEEALHRARSAEALGSVGNYRGTMTFREYASFWLEEADLMPLTKKSYAAVLSMHILPVLGSKRVQDIDRAHVNELLRSLTRKGVGTSTRMYVRAVLGSAFRELAQDDVIESNPMQKVRVKRDAKAFRHVLSPNEFKRIRQCLPNEEARLFALFLALSGCRFGEASELRVRDVNLEQQLVYVERRVNDLGASYNDGVSRFLVVVGTKGGSGRGIPLAEKLVMQLKKHIKAHHLGPDELLFPKRLIAPANRANETVGPTGHGTRYAYNRLGCRCQHCKKANAQYQRSRRGLTSEREAPPLRNISGHLPRDTWRRVWTKAVREAGLSWMPRTHDLRHANATLLLKNGVDVHEVKERLGHSSITTTEGYLHRLKASERKAAEAVSAFL